MVIIAHDEPLKTMYPPFGYIHTILGSECYTVHSLSR